MQKTAKNISLSIAGVMVAVPAGADIASIDYVQRWVQNQSPIPAGSVIAGYASGPYGSYLLAGTTVGGPYNAVSISDIGSKMSPYIDVKSLGNGYSGNDGVLTAGGWNSYSYFGTQLASASATGMGAILGTVIGSYIQGSHITGVNGNSVLFGYNDYALSGSGSVWLVGGTGSSSGNGLLSASKLGSKIAGYGVSTGYEGYVMVGRSTSDAPTYQSTTDFIQKSLAPYSYIFAMPGYSGGFVNNYLYSYGSYIGGYQSGGSAAMTKILGFTGTGSVSIGAETAKWFDVSGLGSYLKGSQISGYDLVNSGTGSFIVMAGWDGGNITGAKPGWVGAYSFGSYISPYLHSYLKGSQISGYDFVNSGTGSFIVMAGWDGLGNSTGAKPGWVDAYSFVSNIYPYLDGSRITNIRGSKISGYNTTGFSSGYTGYILAGSSTSGGASWMKISSDSGRGLTDHLFGGNMAGAPAYILGSTSNSTGVIPAYHSVSKLGTVIGTVNGSQVKIEQTATAETLQANTGTIYFPVVQNGKIYGVTLNDFYILMNAQF